MPPPATATAYTATAATCPTAATAPAPADHAATAPAAAIEQPCHTSRAAPTAAPPPPAARPTNTLAAPISLTVAELFQRVHLPAATPRPPPAPHGRPRPDLTATRFSQLPHGIRRWVQVAQLNANDPTTFTGLHTLRAALAHADDPASRLAAATSAFAAEGIHADLLSEPDHGIPPLVGLR